MILLGSPSFSNDGAWLESFWLSSELRVEGSGGERGDHVVAASDVAAVLVAPDAPSVEEEQLVERDLEVRERRFERRLFVARHAEAAGVRDESRVRASRLDVDRLVIGLECAENRCEDVVHGDLRLVQRHDVASCV